MAKGYDNDRLRADEQVFYNHAGVAGWLKAKVLRVTADRSHVILSVEGWLGTHWVPLNRVSRTPID